MVSTPKGSFERLRSNPIHQTPHRAPPGQSSSRAVWFMALVGMGALVLIGACLGDDKVAPAEKGTVAVAGG